MMLVPKAQFVVAWLKDVASLNMYDILTRLPLMPNELEKGWLKLVAPANMYAILVTRLVCQLLRGWWKAFAP